MKPPHFDYDPQSSGPQYLEDLATGYWFSEVLFTAVAAGVFDLLAGGGLTVSDLAERLRWEPRGTERLLRALCVLGLLFQDGEWYGNTTLAATCLVKGQAGYQGDSILWRQHLQADWGGLTGCLQAGGRVSYLPDGEPDQLRQRLHSYILAMDNVARTKAREIWPLFTGSFGHADGVGEGAQGGLEILDVGAGSGAISAGFLEQFPAARATLLDLAAVLDIARELLDARGLGQRVTCCQANILEPWPVPAGRYDLVLLSNIVHAYSEQELPDILSRAARCLSPGGYLVVHDFFSGHAPAKAALLDLNMFINTYNGRVFPEQWVRERLSLLGLQATELVPLPSDTALIIAAADPEALDRLSLDGTARLAGQIRTLGFRQVKLIPSAQVQVADWTDLRCLYGCPLYGRPHCPPDSPDADKTRAVLQDFQAALLLEGEPPTQDFQRRVLKAEREAFRAGYYKAIAYWAGPCSLCASCPPDGCRNRQEARPSMEAAGIDVFATVRRAGLSLTTLGDGHPYVKYFALLLLE